MTPRSRIFSVLLGAAFGLVSVGNGFAMTASPLTVKTDHGVPYVSGGVSMGERQTLRHMTKEDNVQLIFAARNRDYLSDVTVRITDDKGREVLHTVAQGPWLFTRLPAGKYTIRATTQGESQGAVVEAPATGQSRVYLTWNDAILQSPPHSVVNG